MEKELKQHTENLRLKADLEGNYLIAKGHQADKNIGIFYAPSGGAVHKVARLIKQKLGECHPDLYCISDVNTNKILDYQVLIFISSSLGRNTWEMEQKDPWSSFLPKLLRLQLEGRKVALIGLGDHVSYPNNFADGMGILAERIEEIGGKLIGETETCDYIFNDSKAVRQGKFVGLPLDEDYEADKTAQRIEAWWQRIKAEVRDGTI
ncbi:MAG: flavodoxin domain-containing protein [Odoribacter sp.]